MCVGKKEKTGIADNVPRACEGGSFNKLTRKK